MTPRDEFGVEDNPWGGVFPMCPHWDWSPSSAPGLEEWAESQLDERMRAYYGFAGRDEMIVGVDGNNVTAFYSQMLRYYG